MLLEGIDNRGRRRARQVAAEPPIIPSAESETPLSYFTSEFTPNESLSFVITSPEFRK